MTTTCGHLYLIDVAEAVTTYGACSLSSAPLTFGLGLRLLIAVRLLSTGPGIPLPFSFTHPVLWGDLLTTRHGYLDPFRR